MSTTIDTLDIKINTSAGSASDNLEDLAQALEKLKNNADLSGTAKNLRSLAGALEKIKSSASGSGDFTKMMTALSGLSGVQKSPGLVSTVNALKKASDVASTLDASKVQSFSAVMSSLGDGMRGIGEIPKLSGLTSTVNALGKIPKLTQDLGDDEIDQFTQKVEKLAKALQPLSERLSVVAASFAKLPSRVSSVVTATNRMDKSYKSLNKTIDTTTLNFANLVTSVQGIYAVLMPVQQLLTNTISTAMEWDGIQYRFGRAFGEDAEEVYNWILRINEEMGINVQEFMQQSSLYGSLLKGFGVEQKNVTAIALGMTEMSYDMWAAMNDRAKTIEEVADAVRSAISGEIEPIRNLGVPMSEASLKELLVTLGEINVNYENFSEAQKAQVRYQAMVNAVMGQDIVGTYAQEMKTAEGVVRDLSQRMKTLAQAFGSLFLPVLTTVVPWISAFVSIMYDAVAAVAAFFSIPLFNTNFSGVAEGLGNVAKSAGSAGKAIGGAGAAAKALQDYTMGFDELNIIDPPDPTSGGGGGGVSGGTDWGGLDLESLWDESIFAQVQSDVDELKMKILGFFDEWKLLIVSIGVALGGLMLWNRFGEPLTKIFKMFKGGESVFKIFTEIFPKAAGVITKITAPLSALGTFLAGLSTPVLATIAGVLIAIGAAAYYVYENFDQVKRVAKEFFDSNIQPKIDDLAEAWDNLKETMKPVSDTLKEVFDGLDFSGVGKSIEIIGGVIYHVFASVIAGAFNAVMTLISGFVQMVSGVASVVSGVIRVIVGLFTGDFAMVKDAVRDIVSGVEDTFLGFYKSTIGVVVSFVDGVIQWFLELYDELVGHSIVPDLCEAIIDWFKSLPDNVIQFVKDLVNKVTTKFEEMKSGIHRKLMAVKAAIVQQWIEIKKWFDENVAPKLTATYWADKISAFVDVGKDVVSNIMSGLKTKWEELKKWWSELELPSFQIKKPELSWSSTPATGWIKETLAALGLPTSIPKLNITWEAFANGGFPDMGQMFIAREAGPEMVGTIGGKTAVANNDQIVTAVSQGVYSAVVAAMAQSQGNGGNQDIKVYLDGKQIYASVKKTERERGVNLMGSQLGYAY